ncbi:unnamed protein product [Adineta ricciae]|uniref:ABC transmembrane type-1 domain-containing protein n=1 Tax=Adineta ricciae TaxID=249248 RepID=A0A814Z7R8_ADIRI|nr:unnamed protein product [Adineta ricciae]
MHSINEFSSKLFSNIETIEKGIGYDLTVILGLMLCVTFGIIISFIINWKLSLILSVFVPLLLTSSNVFAKIISNETINELRAYDKELNSTRWNTIRKGAAFGIFSGWLSLGSYAIYTVGFIFGSILMIQKNEEELNFIKILIIITMFAQCARYFNLIGPLFQSCSEAQGAAISVIRFIDENNN